MDGLQVIGRLIPAKADVSHKRDAEECLDLLLQHTPEYLTQETRQKETVVIRVNLSANINALHQRLKQLR